MKRIKLTQGKVALVSDIDYAYLNQWKWCYHKSGYAIRTDYTKGKITIWLHRVILKRMGCQKFIQCDHKNCHRLDDRRCNLRPATIPQNRQNHTKRVTNLSVYKGVSWQRQLKKWHVRIQIGGSAKFLGYFISKKDAERIYNRAAKKYFGKFAKLNKIIGERNAV